MVTAVGRSVVLALALVLAGSEAKASCHESSTSRVVGRRNCRRFGSGWLTSSSIGNILNVDIDLGGGVTSVDGSSHEVSICAPHGRSCAVLRTDRWAPGSARATLGMASLHDNVFRLGPMRAGIGADLAWGEWSARLQRSPGTVVGAPFAGYFYGHVGAMIGAGRWVFGAEVRAGVVSLSGSITDAAGATESAGSSWFSLRAMGSVHYYVHPFVAVGVYGGGDVLGNGDWFAGAGFRFSVMRAYGGTRD